MTEEASRFTYKEKLECVERELRYRHRVYGRRVSKRLMTRSFASHELALMQAIVLDYADLAAKERLL